MEFTPTLCGCGTFPTARGAPSIVKFPERVSIPYEVIEWRLESKTKRYFPYGSMSNEAGVFGRLILPTRDNDPEVVSPNSVIVLSPAFAGRIGLYSDDIDSMRINISVRP